MNSPFSYVGGKVKIADWIISHFPADYRKLHYCEPFFGSGAVFFAKAKSAHESINDKDSVITNIWHCFQDRDTMIRLTGVFESFIWSEDLFKEAEAVLSQEMPKEPDMDTRFRYAVAFLQKNYSSFAGTNSFGFFKKMDNGRLCRPYRKTLLFAGANARLRGVQIFNRPAEEVIKLIDSSDALFYCDTPYVGTDQKTYANEYKAEDLLNLIGILRACKGRWLLSCYEKNLDLFDTRGLVIHRIKKLVSFNFANQVQRQADECLVCNFKAGQRSFFEQ